MKPTATPQEISFHELITLLQERSEARWVKVWTEEDGTLAFRVSVAVRGDMDGRLIRNTRDAVTAIAAYLASDDGIRAALNGDLQSVIVVAQKHGIPFDAGLTKTMIQNMQDAIDEGEHTWVSSSAQC